MPAVSFETALPDCFTIASDLHAARDIEDQVLKVVEDFGYAQQCVFAIRLALEEALVNAHRHGNGCNPDKNIAISYRIDRQRVVIRVRDEGAGFDPASIPDPTCPERICLPTGRGIMLMRSYLDEVTFNARGNEVQLVKERC